MNQVPVAEYSAQSAPECHQLGTDAQRPSHTSQSRSDLFWSEAEKRGATKLAASFIVKTPPVRTFFLHKYYTHTWITTWSVYNSLPLHNARSPKPNDVIPTAHY